MCRFVHRWWIVRAGRDVELRNLGCQAAVDSADVLRTGDSKSAVLLSLGDTDAKTKVV